MKFYHKSLELEVPDTVYYPREDSLLVTKILEKMDLKGKRCLDVGCGSGFLAILMAKQGADVTATDINENAIEAATKNAKSNNVKLEIIHSDLFEEIEDTFDLIVFNPPYLPVDDKHTDESYAGGKTGRETIEKFIKEAKSRLAANGKIILLFSSLTGEKEVLDTAEKCGYRTGILEREKLDWEEIILMRLEAFRS